MYMICIFSYEYICIHLPIYIYIYSIAIVRVGLRFASRVCGWRALWKVRCFILSRIRRACRTVSCCLQSRGTRAKPKRFEGGKRKSKTTTHTHTRAVLFVQRLSAHVLTPSLHTWGRGRSDSGSTGPGFEYFRVFKDGCCMAGGWWLVAGGWWLVAGGWWL